MEVEGHRFASVEGHFNFFQRILRVRSNRPSGGDFEEEPQDGEVTLVKLADGAEEVTELYAMMVEAESDFELVPLATGLVLLRRDQ